MASGGDPLVDQFIADFLAGASLRWRDRRGLWRPADEGGFDPRRYRVMEIAVKPAKQFVVRHHYSGTFPSAKRRYGLFEGDHLVGVVVLGVGQHKQVICKPFPTIDYNEGAELARLVLTDEVPANAESWFVARAFTLAAGEGLRAVVSFSDPVPRYAAGTLTMPGHVGIVYQALNARYTGRSKAETVDVLPDGTVLGGRLRAKLRNRETGWRYCVARLVGLGAPAPSDVEDLGEWLDTALRTLGAVRARHAGKHRYCWAIGNRGNRRRTPIAFDPQDYPKAIDTTPLGA